MNFLPELLAKLVQRKFGIWQQCEGIRSKLIEAVGIDAVDVAKLTTAYISTALPFIPKWVYAGWFWQDQMYLFSLVTKRLQPKDLPILRAGSKTSRDTVSWEYEDRPELYAIHTLAQAYGWSVEYIRGLDMDVALALLQEVWTDDFLHKEFAYSLSEIAYPYNPSSKKSTFKPISRPYWMLEKVKPVRTYSIPMAMMPAGVANDSMAQELVQKFRDFQAKK